MSQKLPERSEGTNARNSIHLSVSTTNVTQQPLFFVQLEEAPEFLLRILERPQTEAPTSTTRPTARARYGCPEQICRIRKKKCSIELTVDFGLSFGGEATTFLRVSRIEVREGTMGLPVIV